MVKLEGINNSGGYKNLLIGGDFGTSPWQRGTSGNTNPAGFMYTADRWYLYRRYSLDQSGMFYAKSSTTDIPGTTAGCQFGRAPGTTNAGRLIFGQSIESSNCSKVAGKRCSLSFWCKAGGSLSTATAGMGVTVRVGTQIDASPPTLDYNENYAFDATISLPSTSYSFNTINNIYIPSNTTQIIVEFNYTPWEIAAASNEYLEVALIQFEEGSIPSPFEFKSSSVVETECRRYFNRVANVSWAKASNSDTIPLSVQFPVVMRVTPTIIIKDSSGNQGGLNYFFGYTTAPNSGVNAYGITPGGFNYLTKGGGLYAGEIYNFNYTADAEIY